MENKTQVRACFAGLNVKAGKTVLQFELDPEHKGALPQLAMMTGTYVTMELTSDQKVLFKERDREDVEVVEEDEDHTLPEPILEYEYDDDEAA